MDDRYLFNVQERCSWPRITKLRHKALLSQLSRIASPTLQDQYTVHVKVRLQPFERILLEQTLAQLGLSHIFPSSGLSSKKPISDIDASCTAILLFFRWSWADNVLRQALSELDPEWVDECYDGNFKSALEVFRSQLRTRVRSRNDLYDRRYYRVEQLMRDNGHLGDRTGVVLEEVTVVPCNEDWGLWKNLGRFVLANVGDVGTWPGFRRDLRDCMRMVEGEDFGGAMRAYVAHLVEATPDFPPRGLFQGISDEVDGPSDAEDESPSGGEITTERSPEQDLERTKDYAKITVMNIIAAEDLWDVWSFCRMLMVSAHNLHHQGELENFLGTPEFMRCWQLVSQDDDGNVRDILPMDPVSELLSQRPSEIAGNFFIEDAQEFMDLEYRQQQHGSPLGEPKLYLPFIPWNMLEFVHPDSVPDLKIGLGLDSKSLPGTFCTYPIASNDIIHHSIYLTDDLFARCVDSEYRYPGLVTGDKLIFLMQKLAQTKFVQQLRFFWELWNDCAITCDPNTKEFYLLQTLPGVKARQQEDRAGIWAAFEFFDLKYRHRDTLSTQHDMLSQMLGKEFNPSYSDFLIFIDSKEIDLANMKAIGQGSFGCVYKASWERKPKKVYDHAEESKGDIALKVALSHKSWDERAKFFSELATVYSALAGDSNGCVPFYGFCKVFIDDDGEVLDSNSPSGLPKSARETFALVFDFAAKGELIPFMKERLRPGEPEENWLVVCEALSGLAAGLMTIHKKDIIHRDIYPKNVLVQSIKLAGDEEPEFDCLLSDLGEGKNLSYSAESREYMAPNISSSSIGAKADDIYAWGRLGVEIISTYYHLLRNPDGGLYPAALMRVLERCLDPSPEGRFDAKTLVVLMDEVMDGPGGLAAMAYGNEVEWYDDGYELPQLRKKMESSLELKEHWLTLSSEKAKMYDDMME